MIVLVIGLILMGTGFMIGGFGILFSPLEDHRNAILLSCLTVGFVGAGMLTLSLATV